MVRFVTVITYIPPTTITQVYVLFTDKQTACTTLCFMVMTHVVSTALTVDNPALKDVLAAKVGFTANITCKNTHITSYTGASGMSTVVYSFVFLTLTA